MLLLLLLLLVVLLPEGVGVAAAKGSWRYYKKELVLCQPIELQNMFRISFLLSFSFLKLSSKKTKKQKFRRSPLAIAV